MMSNQILQGLGIAGFALLTSIAQASQQAPGSIILGSSFANSGKTSGYIENFADRSTCTLNWQANSASVLTAGNKLNGAYSCIDRTSFHESDPLGTSSKVTYVYFKGSGFELSVQCERHGWNPLPYISLNELKSRVSELASLDDSACSDESN